MSSGLGELAPRSRLYRLLRAGFLYPDDEFFARIEEGSWLEDLSAAGAALPYSPAISEDLVQAPESLEAIQVEYSHLFDAGPGGPPCSLFGGHYESDRLRAMEETIRFYEYFGLHFDRSVGVFPDHITVELEFLEYLASHPPGAPDSASYLRAQKDFLERHPSRWVPRLQEAVERKAEIPFYRGLVSFAAAFLQADRRYVLSALRQSTG